MLIKMTKASDIKSSEITPKEVFDDRRRFLKTAALAGLGFAAGSIAPSSFANEGRRKKLIGIEPSKWTQKSVGEKLTDYESVTSYNNFYEFGTGKQDPLTYAKDFNPKPWSVVVDGEVENPGTYSYEDLVNPHTLEDRVYRFRCVEAWSMVVPWVGIGLADIFKRFGPKNDAKYVAFETLNDPDRMYGQRRRVLARLRAQPSTVCGTGAVWGNWQPLPSVSHLTRWTFTSHFHCASELYRRLGSGGPSGLAR